MPRIETFRDLGCLVTGASAGIGREIARRLARDGARLVLTARRRDRLEGLAEEARSLGAPAVHVIPEDLASAGAPARILAAAEDCLGHVDVLINNAGFAVPGVVVRSNTGRAGSMIDLNVRATHDLLRGVLPGMVRRGKGGVLNVASIAGFQCAPYQSGYSATKAFLLNLSNGVHQEVKHQGICVTALCPGVTDTEFFDAAGYKNLSGFMNWRMPADKVARIGLKALRNGKMEVVPGISNKLLIFSQRLLPRSWVAALSRRILASRPQPGRSSRSR